MAGSTTSCRCAIGSFTSDSRSRFRSGTRSLASKSSKCYRVPGCSTCARMPWNKNQKTKPMGEKIGFVGVGRMGSNMARRLKECGYEIAAVYDVNTPAAEAVGQELGCRSAAELSEVTKAAEIIITVV